MNKYHLSVSLTGHGEWSQVDGAIEHRHPTPPELIQVRSKRCVPGCVSFMLVLERENLPCHLLPCQLTGQYDSYPGHV